MSLHVSREEVGLDMDACVRANLQLQRAVLNANNVHLLDTDLLCADPVLQYKYATRNLRLLHNWQCICVLFASYRANAHSSICDSILSLVPEVMGFLVPEDWAVVRCR